MLEGLVTESIRKLIMLFTFNRKKTYFACWTVACPLKTFIDKHCINTPWILRIFPYLVQTRKNKDQNNSEYGHFLRSEMFEKCDNEKEKDIFNTS